MKIYIYILHSFWRLFFQLQLFVELLHLFFEIFFQLGHTPYCWALGYHRWFGELEFTSGWWVKRWQTVCWLSTSLVDGDGDGVVSSRLCRLFFPSNYVLKLPTSERATCRKAAWPMHQTGDTPEKQKPCWRRHARRETTDGLLFQSVGLWLCALVRFQFQSKAISGYLSSEEVSDWKQLTSNAWNTQLLINFKSFFSPVQSISDWLVDNQTGP